MDLRLDSYFDESEKLNVSADLKIEYAMPKSDSKMLVVIV